MKPESNQRTSRFRCVERAALNGIHAWSPSHPMCAKPMMKPNTSWSGSNSIEVAKNRYAMRWLRNFISSSYFSVESHATSAARVESSIGSLGIAVPGLTAVGSASQRSSSSGVLRCATPSSAGPTRPPLPPTA